VSQGFEVRDNIIFQEGAVTMQAHLPKHLFLWFACAIPRVDLLVILIKLAISIYFDCAPAISMAISTILIYFDLHVEGLFRSFWSISIILIYFNSFQFRHRNRQNILMARRPFWSFHHVTSKMAHDGGCCHLTFGSFTPIMAHPVWYVDSVIEKWKNYNKPMRRKSDFAAQWKRNVGLFLHRQRIFWPFFLGMYHLLGSL
jgi:hypothetical protein